MDSTKRTLSATVRGYVQGVGFRVFVRSAAWRLGVPGYVRNMPDGSLLVVASGDQTSLDKLLKEVWRGPAGAHVTSVDEQWTDSETPGLPASFEVRH